ncbi:MAG: enoyl-CoA hydratase-related protein [Candidatus Bathyarchaeia archaeon]
MVIEYEKREKIGKIILKNPEKINPLSFEVLRSLERLIEEIAEERETRVMILTGAGGNFSTGHNLRESERFSVEDRMKIIKMAEFWIMSSHLVGAFHGGGSPSAALIFLQYLADFC